MSASDGFGRRQLRDRAKYLHDLTMWNAISVEEQERIIGRIKLADIELSDDVKPSNSHVALNTIVDENGAQQQIVRDNMPFGQIGAEEFGTYFIGYAATGGLGQRFVQGGQGGPESSASSR